MSEAVTTQSPAMRIIESPIGPVIPVIDVADMIGYSRGSITKAIKEHEGKMSPCKTFITLPTPGGPQQFLCLNRIGIDYLFLFIHPAKTRMSDDEYIEFRKSILLKMDVGKPDARKPVIPAIDTELQNARHLAEVCGQEAGAFQAAVFKKHGMPEFADIVRPPVVHGETGWYSVTQLCELAADESLEGHPERLNNYLRNRGFQYKEERVWRLQPAGEVHGKEYWFESYTGHREIRIRWRESILYASGLKRELSPSQMVLPAKAGA
jgi:hypothetical protein